MIDITHAMNVSNMARSIGIHMGLTENECTILSVGGLFHDVGKVNLPITLLDKPGALTQDERSVIELHAQLGYNLLRHMPDSVHKEVADIVLSHHERLDGKGYPQGLRGDQIPLFSRIISVCDVMDALMTDRPYRAAWHSREARKYMRENIGTQFDFDVVKILLTVVMPPQRL